MKKLFGKTDSKNDANVKCVSNYVGKSFILGKMPLVVEEVLAEGEIHAHFFIYFYP